MQSLDFSDSGHSLKDFSLHSTGPHSFFPLKDSLLFLLICECMCLCVYMSYVPMEFERGCPITGNWSYTSGCEPPDNWCWELNLGSLEQECS